MRKKVKEWLGVLSGFRKLAMAGVYLIVAIILLIFGLIPEEDWLKHTSGVMIAFMATNIGERITEVFQSWLKKKP